MSVDEGTTRGVELDQAIRNLMGGSAEAAQAYLKQVWLSRAMDALGRARKKAGLTQAQLAERLGTTQSAVARAENDDDGGISLRRYLDYALACGTFPPDLELAPLAEMLALTSASPSASRTGMDVGMWKMVHKGMRQAAEQATRNACGSRVVSAGVAPDPIASLQWNPYVTGQHLVFQDCAPLRAAQCPASGSQSSEERAATYRASVPAQSSLAEDQKVAA